MDVRDGGLKYWIENGEALVLGFDIISDTLIIPESVHNFPITGIANYAFNHSNIKEAYLPNSICNIGRGAFSDCVELKVVSFYNTNTPNNNDKVVIQNHVFSDCCSLEKFYAPFMHISVETRGFNRCESLTDLNVNIAALKGISLDRCQSLLYLIFDDNAIVDDLSIGDMPNLQNITFKGDAEVNGFILRKIHANHIPIICSATSKFAELSYYGFLIKILDK